MLRHAPPGHVRRETRGEGGNYPERPIRPLSRLPNSGRQDEHGSQQRATPQEHDAGRPIGPVRLRKLEQLLEEVEDRLS
jgi:hypothetical protein